MPRPREEDFFPSDDYKCGYHTGFNANLERTDFDAYYAGVGYGK